MAHQGLGGHEGLWDQHDVRDVSDVQVSRGEHDDVELPGVVCGAVPEGSIAIAVPGPESSGKCFGCGLVLQAGVVWL